MVIYSLLSETVLYSSKKKKKIEEKKKQKKPINPVLLSLKMFPLPIACVISKKKKNQRSKSHGIKVIYIQVIDSFMVHLKIYTKEANKNLLSHFDW